MDSDPQFLRKTSLVRQLPPDEQERLIRSCHLHQYQKGAMLFAEGAPCDAAWILAEGLVRIVKYSEQGQAMTLELIMPGDIFGAVCTLDGSPYPCTAMAVTGVTAYRIHSGEFQNLVKECRECEQAVFSEARNRLRTAQTWRSLLQEPVERRIIHVLLQLVQRFGTTIPLTRRDIAEMAGTTVESAIRTLSDLMKQGLITSGRGHIEVSDPDALEEHLSHLSGPAKA